MSLRMTQAQRYYTMIGSRETPPAACDELTRYAAQMHANGWIGRSGGAFGADKAGEAGMGELKEIILPRDRHVFSLKTNNGKISDPPRFADGKTTFVPPPDLKALRRNIASNIHPNWPAVMNIPTADLSHERNVCQILGLRCERLSEVVIFWAPVRNGKVQGGTATAVAIARECGVPTFNLADERDRARLASIDRSIESGATLQDALASYRDGKKALEFERKYGLAFTNEWVRSAEADLGEQPHWPSKFHFVNVNTAKKTQANLAPNDVYCGREHPRCGFPASPLRNNHHIGDPGPDGKPLKRDEAAKAGWGDLRAAVAANDPIIMAEGERIADLVERHGAVNLVCFCEPNTCHTHKIPELLVIPILEQRFEQHRETTQQKPMSLEESALAAVQRGEEIIREKTGAQGKVTTGERIENGEVLDIIGPVVIVRDGYSGFAIYDMNDRAKGAATVAVGDRAHFSRSPYGVRIIECTPQPVRDRSDPYRSTAYSDPGLARGNDREQQATFER